MAGQRAPRPSKSTAKKATTAKATPKRATGDATGAKPTARPASRSATASDPTVVAATDGQPISELIDEVGAGGETHQRARGQQDRLTTQQGVPVADDQNTLRAGARGPALLEDFHFREKIFHFDHERIPERVVHARGFGAHGFFEPYESLVRPHPRRPVPTPGRADTGVRPVLDRGREQGLLRPGP